MDEWSVIRGFLFILSLIAIIVAFFIVSMIGYHRRFLQLQEQRIRNEIDILEEERSRMASDIHDSIGPLLSATKLHINNLEVSGESDRQGINRINKQLDQVLRDIRHISHDLKPVALQQRGLADALRDYIHRINSDHPAFIELRIDEDIKSASHSDIHIFRILQEIIQNTQKHAQAKTLHITILREKSKLIILTRDDGCGIPEYKANNPEGLGISSIKSRVNILKGELEMINRPGEGLQYQISIPN